MSNIVERLRGAVKGTAGLDEAEERALLSDAADEIERLRKLMDLSMRLVNLVQGDIDAGEPVSPTRREVVDSLRRLAVTA